MVSVFVDALNTQLDAILKRDISCTLMRGAAFHSLLFSLSLGDQDHLCGNTNLC
jgi:hypothetical protein